MSDMYFRIIMCSLCHLVAALTLKGTAITIKAFVKQHSTSVQQAVLYKFNGHVAGNSMTTLSTPLVP